MISNDRTSAAGSTGSYGSGSYGSTSADTSASSKIASMSNAAGEQISEAAGQAQQAAQVQLDRLAESIRRNPMQATGIAAGIGFMLAFVARR